MLWIATQDAIPLVAATAKTVVRSSVGANQIHKFKSVEFQFDGATVGNTPVRVEYLRETAISAPTGTALTVAKGWPGSSVFEGSVLYNCSAEGSPTLEALGNWRIHPQAGVWYPIPLGDEEQVEVSLAWRFRLTAAQVVNATFRIKLLEGG